MSARSANLGTAVAVLAAAVLAAAVLAGPGTAATAASAATASCSAWKVVPSPGPGSATMSAVAATSATDVWAVGSYYTGSAYRTLIEHWTGAHWQVVKSPNPAQGSGPTDTLDAVVALSPTNAWAFGFYEKTSTSFRTLIEHWNGAVWSVVPSPNSGPGENALAAGAARNAHDIWAVGYRQQGTGPRKTLTEHWNGSTWSIVASPNAGAGDGNLLFGAAVSPKGPPWTVGTSPRSFSQTLALRWNGRTWTVGPTPSPGDGDRFLQAVAEPSARYALAVGSDLAGSQIRSLAERWTGSHWSVVPSASPSRYYNSLQAVTATGTAQAWAVGSQEPTQGVRFRTLTEHWNGSAWTTVNSPSPGTGDDWLYGVAAVPGGGIWAVGNAGGATLTEFHC